MLKVLKTTITVLHSNDDLPTYKYIISAYNSETDPESDVMVENGFTDFDQFTKSFFAELDKMAGHANFDLDKVLS